MHQLAFIGYQLLYIQVPFIIAPLPNSDLSRFSWSQRESYVGLYPYRDSVIGQFTLQNYYTRSILGEEDIFLLTSKRITSDIPYSFFRMVNNGYKFLHLNFNRTLEWGDINGGLWGLHIYGEDLKGYGNLFLPLDIKGREVDLSLSIYGNTKSISLNSPYLFMGTTEDRWLGYLKVGDFRVGSTPEKQFISYLFRPIDPVFLIMAELVGEGSYAERKWEMTEWYVSPLYVLSLESSIYCVISETPSIGLKTVIGDIELGKESYLSVRTDILNAFITYSVEDSLPRGGVGGRISHSFYHDRITPIISGAFHSGEFDLELALKILEVESFLGMRDVPYGYLFWGMNVDFSF